MRYIMTKVERNQMIQLMQTITDLTLLMIDFKNTVNSKIADIDKKVINQPLKLETDFNNNINDIICKALLNQLSNGYNSPIKSILQTIVSKNKLFIENAVENAINELQELSLKDEIKKQLVKSVVSDCINSTGGIVDKYFNTIKQDPIFRSKLNVAIDKLVIDLINE